MLIIELPKGHGVSAYLTRTAIDVTNNNKVLLKQHVLRIGRTVKEHQFS